jgi:hypothetical protein
MKSWENVKFKKYLLENLRRFHGTYNNNIKTDISKMSFDDVEWIQLITTKSNDDLASHKMWGISSLIDGRLVSQECLCYMDYYVELEERFIPCKSLHKQKNILSCSYVTHDMHEVHFAVCQWS